MKVLHKVKTHYGGQKMLQILFFKTMQLSTSTKSVFFFKFINYTLNKVVHLSNDEIVKGNYTFKLILNDWKLYLWKNKCCHYIIQNTNIL